MLPSMIKSPGQAASVWRGRNTVTMSPLLERAILEGTRDPCRSALDRIVHSIARARFRR
jgi:hypothetical protein